MRHRVDHTPAISRSILTNGSRSNAPDRFDHEWAALGQRRAAARSGYGVAVATGSEEEDGEAHQVCRTLLMLNLLAGRQGAHGVDDNCSPESFSPSVALRRC